MFLARSRAGAAPACLRRSCRSIPAAWVLRSGVADRRIDEGAVGRGAAWAVDHKEQHRLSHPRQGMDRVAFKPEQPGSASSGGSAVQSVPRRDGTWRYAPQSRWGCAATPRQARKTRQLASGRSGRKSIGKHGRGGFRQADDDARRAKRAERTPSPAAGGAGLMPHRRQGCGHRDAGRRSPRKFRVQFRGDARGLRR